MRPAAPPHLCMVVHGPFPIGEPRVAREARAALAAGWSVDVIALRRPNEPHREMCGGVRVYRLPLQHARGGGPSRVVFEYAAFAALATVVVALLNVRKRYNVVQIHNPPDFLLVAGLFPRALGARLILDIHDLSPDMFDARFESTTVTRALRVVERLAVRVADAVITVHDPYRRELARAGAADTKVTVVLNTPDESLLPAPAPNDPTIFRIVFHGTVTPHYGIDLVVRALPSVLAAAQRPVVFEIYGEGDFLETALSLARELGVGEAVRASGRYLPHEEVLRAVNGAAVGIVSNRRNQLNRFALSSKLFEYVLLGIPVVAARLPTLEEYFDDSAVAYFVPDDVTSLAETLAALATDTEGKRASAMRTAALSQIEPLRWKHSAAAYVDLLDSLRRERRPRGFS